MGVLRTVLAMGALVLSVPVMAQDGRTGWDRSRVEGSRNARGSRSDGKSGSRVETRRETRSPAKSENRSVNHSGNRVSERVEVHPGSVPGSRYERRGGAPVDVRPPRFERNDRGEAPRIAVRPPIIERYDRRDNRVRGRYAPFSGRAVYRYGDRDFRHRDVLTITAWFRALGPSRMSVYGVYDGSWPAERPVFRPGLYLSMAVFSRLDVLPYELEFELGELPWYLERRIYGNTVLVIDTRTRTVVDLYDIDY